MKHQVTCTKIKTYISKPNVDGKRIPMWLYALTGSPEALSAYKELKTAEGYYEEDEQGHPLWHSCEFGGDTCQAIVSDKGVFIPKDNTLIEEQAEIDKLPEGAVKDAIVAEYAKTFIARMKQRQSNKATTQAVPVEDPEIILPQDE